MGQGPASGASSCDTQAISDEISAAGQRVITAISAAPRFTQAGSDHTISMELADFVERRFIPEYAMQQRAAGRAHFQAILKHVLSPERIERAFRTDRQKSKAKPAAILGWPYLDSLRLSDVTTENLQHLLQALMDRGYAPQTAIHIRNALRLIFSHAITSGELIGANPAAELPAPAIVRKQARTLTLLQLKRAMELMRYPEKHISLFALLTDMSVGEICGLKWKYVNVSDQPGLIGWEQVPPRSLAVRMHSFRGELSAVRGKRNRYISLLEPLHSELQSLGLRPDFTAAEDFVLASRTGTQVNPDNIAGRRLKNIGDSLSAPWISWKVFRHTGMALKAEFGLRMQKEIENVIPHRRR